MRKNILNKCLAITLLLALFGCKTKKEFISSKPTSAAVSTGSKTEVLKIIGNNSAKYSTLSIKAKADLNIDGNQNDVSLNIRVRHGEAIWVFVTALAGLEVARAYITPDSIQIINRLESTYTNKPFKYIYEFTNPRVDFNTLETIIAGNPQKEVVTESSELSVQDNQIVLKRVIESLIYLLRFNDLHKVVQTSLGDDSAAQNLSVDYGEFMKVEDQIFPHLVKIKSRVERKNVVIDLKYNRIGINEIVEMPFTVPKRFTVKN
jgi:hypothetical protein